MKDTSNRVIRARRSLPAIVAVGSSLAALPAAALELGDLTVHSRLGQPLRASIAYALGPSEQIDNYCIKMRPGSSLSGLPGFGDATISVANGVIMLTGHSAVREPMVSAHVVINCPYSGNLSREYLIFIDPLISPYERAVVTQLASPSADSIAATPTAISGPVAKATPRPILKGISKGARYQVQRGDSLSIIAQRIENRSIGLFAAVNAIFDANPDAFLNNDPNRLKAGSWLSIPDFDANASVIVAAEPSADAIAAAYADTEAYEPYSVAEIVPVEEAAVSPVSDVILDDLAQTGANTDALRPGDIIFDAQLEGPTTASSSPNVPTAIISSERTSTESSASPSWLAWLAGSGLALIFALLMFGRRLRGQPDTTPAAAEQSNQRHFSDPQSANTANVEALVVDFDISDESPTHENLILDADLIIGTGLTDRSESDLSQDFGFAATTALDIELPFETIASIADETDMLPPLRVSEQSILDSEIFPEDDDYDMSVIVDATKMPRPEDITARDLKAVKIVSDDETMIAQNYTINKQVDYQVLEQDYEDEMTATQALNLEIARVAAELATRMDDADDYATAGLPLVSVMELDITAQMPAQNDDFSDLDDTGINEAITVNTATDEETVEMPYESKKVR